MVEVTAVLYPLVVERVCVEAEDAESLETEPQRCPH
jgi:hypothetical protein